MDVHTHTYANTHICQHTRTQTKDEMLMENVDVLLVSRDVTIPKSHGTIIPR